MSETGGPGPELEQSAKIANPDQAFKKRNLNPFIERVQRIINESRPAPKLGYESTVGVYGGKLTTDSEGKLVYDTTGIVSKIDRFGDPRLREVDDHTANSENRWHLLRKHTKSFWRHYMPFHSLKTPETKRYRGNKEETLEHIRQLGLQAYYGEHPNGIEIKKPEIYSDGINLQDIWRSNEINSPLLNKIDRFAALKATSQYVRTVHDNDGAIGELLPNDIIFQEHTEDGEVSRPVLNLPDIVWNPRKKFGHQEQRATDMMDFMVSIGFEEFRRTQDWDQVQKAVSTIVEGYGQEDPDDSVIKWTGILMKRGRLTTDGAVFTRLHNDPRLGIAKGESEKMRQIVIDTCLQPQTPTPTATAH